MGVDEINKLFFELKNKFSQMDVRDAEQMFEIWAILLKQKYGEEFNDSFNAVMLKICSNVAEAA